MRFKIQLVSQVGLILIYIFFTCVVFMAVQFFIFKKKMFSISNITHIKLTKIKPHSGNKKTKENIEENTQICC